MIDRPDSPIMRAYMKQLGLPYITETKGEYPDSSGSNTYWQATWSCGCVITNDHGKRSIKLCENGQGCFVFTTTKAACDSNGISLSVE